MTGPEYLPEPEPEPEIVVTSLVGLRERDPRVQLDWSTIEDKKVQMSAGEAREFALSILAAAEAAETDAFLFAFLNGVIGVEEKAALGVLRRFREFRDAPHAQE